MIGFVVWMGIALLIWILAEHLRKDCVRKHQREAWEDFMRTHPPTL